MFLPTIFALSKANKSICFLVKIEIELNIIACRGEIRLGT